MSGGHIYFPYLHEGPDRTPGLAISRAAGSITRDVEFSLAAGGAAGAAARSTTLATQVGYGVPAGIGIGYELDQATDSAEGSIKAFRGGGYLSGTLQALGVVAQVAGAVYGFDELGKAAKYADDLRLPKTVEQVNPPKAEVPLVQRGYGDIPVPRGAASGKAFTPATKRKILEANRARNGGILRSDASGTEAVPAQKSMKDVTPPENEAQIDHIVPKSRGGTNSPTNAQVLTRRENRLKSDRFPNE